MQFHQAVRGSAVLLLACVTGSAMAAPMEAERYAVRRQGAWTLAPSSDGSGCFMTRTYPGNGGTTLLFGLDAEGRNHLSVLNEKWSIRPKDRLTLDFRLSNGRYAKQAAVGMVSGGQPGFVTSFPIRFTSDFAASRFLYVDRGDVPVARLMLDGSAQAIAELKRCIAAVSTEPVARALTFDDGGPVPEDPFSRDRNTPSQKRP